MFALEAGYHAPGKAWLGTSALFINVVPKLSECIGLDSPWWRVWAGYGFVLLGIGIALCLSSQLGGADGGLRPDSSEGAAGLGNRVKPRRYAPHPRWDGQARMRLRCQCVKAGGGAAGCAATRRNRDEKVLAGLSALLSSIEADGDSDDVVGDVDVLLVIMSRFSVPYTCHS